MELFTSLWSAYSFPSLKKQAYVMSTEATGDEIQGAFISCCTLCALKRRERTAM